MVVSLLGLPSFLYMSLLIVSTYGYMTPPVTFPSREEKLFYTNEDVGYKNTSVFGVVDKAVILECGDRRPDIYIWGFTKHGTDAMKVVVFDVGKGQQMQTLAQTLGQVTVISNSASISIEKLLLAADGLFTCLAITDLQLFIYYVYLTVQVPISKPYLLVSELSPVEGGTIWMRCNVENGTGPIQYVWQHETEIGNVTVFAQSNSSVVNVTNVNRNNTGWYRCQARNPVNKEQSDRTWLNIIFGPDIPRIDVTPYTMTERGYSALERETVTLQCQAQSNPASQYVWLYNNSQVYSGPQYTITKILRMHTGDYACLAQNTYLNTRSKKTISLTVYFGPDLPQIDVTPNTTTAHGYSTIERENVSLLCQAQSNPPSQYIWIYNNSQVYTGPQFSITSIRRTQTGDYTCLAQNSLLNTSSATNISLTVYYPPVGPHTCSLEVVSNHTSLRLLCSWPGAYPAPTLSWDGDLKINRQEQVGTNLETNIAIFVPSEDKTSNNSVFTCSGTHPAVKQPTKCSVQAYLPPGEPLCFFNVTELYVTLSCFWEGGLPSALVWWEGPGGQGKAGQENSNNMTLRYGAARSEKPYTCHARHPLLFQSMACKITMVAVSKPYLMVSEASPVVGSTIAMTCKVKNGTEPIQYEWQYEARSGIIINVTQSNSSVVILTNLKHNQTGWYHCLARNPVNSQQSDPLWVDVIYAPVGSFSCSMEAPSNHTSLRLLCSWPGGYPTPTLSWDGDLKINRQEQVGTNLETNIAIFVPSEENTSNNSVFTCSATHPAVKQPTECSVHTYLPPRELLCFYNVTELYMTLSCFWEGGLPSALVWWEGPGGQGKAGQENSNNMTLRYGTARSEKPYTCHARHPLLFQSKTCKIAMVPLSKPNLVVSNASPLEGSTVWMRCNLENGTEPIQFVWQYEARSGNTSIFAQNTSVIKLTVKRNDTGWYRCLVSNPVNNEHSDRILLDVTYGPEFPQIDVTPDKVTEHGYTALEQEGVSLRCQAQSNPPSQYVWFYDNSQVYTGPNLTITNILRRQTGDYTCLAQNTFLSTRSKKSISLTVYYPPDGNPLCSVEAALNHTSLRLLCSWPGGFPSPSLIWSGDLVNQEMGMNPKTNTAILLYSQGTVSNNSLFTCQGTHTVLKQPTGCTVQPYVPPGTPQCFAYVTVNSLSQYLMLSCSWDGGLPKVLVWWEGPGLQDKGGQETSNVLTLPYGTARSERPYTCHARHPLLAQTKTCTVPLEPPVLQTQRRMVTVLEGSDVQLTCNLRANNLPANEINWINNHGMGVQDTSKYMLLRSSAWANLTVRDTDERQDSGEYRCTTSNMVGGTEINVTLVVKRHPMPPNATLIKVMYNSRQRNQVDLEWLVHSEQENTGGWTGFILEYKWVSERPGRRGGINDTKEEIQKKRIEVWYSSIIQDPEQRTHILGSLTPTATYHFRITSVNHRTLGHPSAPKTPAEPRYNAYPAIIGAAIGGMLFAAILTALLLMYIIRNRNNNPRLHDLLFGGQHSQSRENIHFPEDEVIGSAEGIENIDAPSTSGPMMALPRAASPLTVTPQSATPSTGQAPSVGDPDEPVNVTITVKAT